MIQDELVFPSEPLSGDALATVELVGHDWRASTDRDWDLFVSVCRVNGAAHGGVVNPNHVRGALTLHGRLAIAPRRLSAFWARATARNGFLDNTDQWTVNNDHKGGNAGKPIRLRKLRTS